MPQVFPFRAVQYVPLGPAGDVSPLIAPPYDVLDVPAKAALLAKNSKNVVGIDLPHIPAKDLGPPSAYTQAASSFRDWLASGTMHRLDKPAMFVYRETFEFRGSTHQRTGMACTIEVQPFGPRPGGGVLPHEETFSGPKEDRFALMKASRAQFSPIFGLHQDAQGAACSLLKRIMASRAPDITAQTNEGFGGPLKHELWTVQDDATINAYADALKGEDIFVADGHHRYNTALNYLKHLESQGPVPADHPARRCMYVLVSMSDPGMVIGPTHRVLAGMSGYSFDAFRAAAGGSLNITEFSGELRGIENAMEQAAQRSKGNALGLYDFATRRCYVATLAAPDPLKERFPGKVRAWRELDVALVQYLIVESICQPKLNGGQPVKWAFPHSIQEVIDIGDGTERGSGGGKAFSPQLAVIVRPTPLEAVREISRANELMPQKSTFFFPKLATGLFINLLE
ncbi:MAG: DUF1015 family protein [Phycisphaerales bacterium]